MNLKCRSKKVFFTIYYSPVAFLKICFVTGIMNNAG
jgi:hypothetical protein